MKLSASLQVFLACPLFSPKGVHLKYWKRFPGDYLRDTIHLSAAEDGMYGRLLDAQYTSEKPLPLDRSLLYAMVRANSQKDQEAVESVLAQFFREKKRGFCHKRTELEIAKAKAKSDAYRVSGRKGGLKRQAIAKQWPSKSSSENQASQTPDSRRLDPESDRFSPNPTLMQKLGVSLSLWTSYKRVREKLHRPIISGAEDLVFAELLAFQQAGEDPIEILERAVRTSSWKLCPIRNGVQSHESFEQQKRRREEKALSEVREGADRVLQQVEDRVPDARSLKSPDGSLPRSIGKSVGK